MKRINPEPWHEGLRYYIYDLDRIPMVPIRDSNYDLIAEVRYPDQPEKVLAAARIISCVNALQGIPDPARTIPALVEALRAFVECNSWAEHKETCFIKCERALSALKEVDR